MSGNSRRLHNKRVVKKTGILLDLGCGETHRDGYVRLDKDKRVKPDICWDLEKFPYPIEKESCIRIVATHIVEHIKPWLMIKFMDELWRISKMGAQFAVKVPYGVNPLYVQDPTHCNPINETTWMYFDPKYSLFAKYRPKPWKIVFSAYQSEGVMESLLEKIPIPKKLDHKIT